MDPMTLGDAMNCYRVATNREVWFVLAAEIGEATALASCRARELGHESSKLRVQEYCGTDLASLVKNGAFTGLTVDTRIRVIVQAMTDSVKSLARITEYLELIVLVEQIERGKR